MRFQSALCSIQGSCHTRGTALGRPIYWYSGLARVCVNTRSPVGLGEPQGDPHTQAQSPLPWSSRLGSALPNEEQQRFGPGRQACEELVGSYIESFCRPLHQRLLIAHHRQTSCRTLFVLHRDDALFFLHHRQELMALLYTARILPEQREAHHQKGRNSHLERGFRQVAESQRSRPDVGRIAESSEFFRHRH